MITRIQPSLQPCDDRRQTWQQQIAGAIRHTDELLRILDILPQDCRDITTNPSQFPLLVPLSYIMRMRKGDPDDPLLRQILPLLREETEIAAEDELDPVADLAAATTPGIIQKYHGRALVMTTGACPVHCRYCFRRHFPYGEQTLSAGKWQQALDYLTAQTQISEVILSGGDPLMLNNRRLATLINEISRIPHIRRLRIHTRTPVMIPDRIDSGLVELLKAVAMPVVLVIHVNHPNEIDAHLSTRLSKLKQAGITLLNQAVLLRDINNHVDTLSELSEKLFAAGVLPYYLHLLDKVAGARHFLIADGEATRLLDAIRQRLPGYLVPLLVREQPGQPAKNPVFRID